uniref:Uncharacterized protein n=1 Tax=Culex tarsalis TaxID=7177 RepID=A0A1Q3G0H5_CULTA
METNCEIIDLCDIKSVKSEDTSSTIPLTIPLDENPATGSAAFTAEESEARQQTTKQWVEQSSQTTGIPFEVADLVNKECAIKLINYLAIYAVNKNMEANLHTTIRSITPDFDPQLNYRCIVGFKSIYQRCFVLFYEALLDLTEIFTQFTPVTQKIIVLWMYNMVEHLCSAQGVDGRFLRHENFIEQILIDFTKTQRETPDNLNIFFDVYQKSLPTEVVPPPAKKPRKPRTKKVKPQTNADSK